MVNSTNLKYNESRMEMVNQAYEWSIIKVRRVLKIDFFRFCIVGAIGFVINTIFLTLTHGVLKINIVVAQLISGEAGLISNFFWHNHWTYKHQNHQDVPFWTKFGRFHASSWSGIVIMTAIVSVGTAVIKLN